MAYTKIASVEWGSSPAIPADFYYDSRRSGGDMEYKIKVVLGGVTGERYFGYPIYLNVKMDNVSLLTHTLKNASPSQWSAGSISYESDWLTVANKYSGNTATAIRLYSGSGSTRSTTYNYSLPVEAQPSTLTIKAGNAGEGITLDVIRYGTEYTHDITYSYDGTVITVCEDSDVLSFRIMPNWANIVPRFPTTQAATLVFAIVTLLDGVEIASSSYTITCPILAEDYAPTASLSVTLDNSANATIAGWGIAVAGFTKLAWDGSSSTGQGGATIVNYAFQFGSITNTGASSSGTTNTLDAAGTITPALTVTDSRGFTNTTSIPDITVYGYNPPMVTSASAVRCDSGGTPSESGTYLLCSANLSCSDLGGHNTKTGKVTYKQEGGSFPTPTTVTFPVKIGGGMISVAHSYVVRISVTDGLDQTYSVDINVPTATVTLHLKQGGLGVGIGKYVEQDNKFDVAWDTELDNDLSVGGDSQFDGDVNVDGAFTVNGQPISTTVDLTSDVTGVLPIANGGTGGDDVATALTNLGLAVETLTVTATKTSGSCTIQDCKAYRQGKVVTLELDIRTTASISAGSVVLEATIDGHFPLCYMSTASFASSYVSAILVRTDGRITIREIVGTLPTSYNVFYSVTYIEA